MSELTSSTFLVLLAMADAPQTRDNVVVEEVSLHLLPGSGETHNHSEASAQRDSAPSCYDRNFRRLAYCSIICGISCIGMFALVNSVKVRSGSNEWCDNVGWSQSLVSTDEEFFTQTCGDSVHGVRDTGWFC